MNKLSGSILLMIFILSLASCDPGHFGKTYIRNQSPFVLELKYKAHLKDTSILIAPGTYCDVYHFGGLGRAKSYDCCACEFQQLSLHPVDTSVALTKDINKKENWLLTNPNTKNFSDKEITCEFQVKAEDIH